MNDHKPPPRHTRPPRLTEDVIPFLLVVVILAVLLSVAWPWVKDLFSGL